MLFVRSLVNVVIMVILDPHICKSDLRNYLVYFHQN